MNNEESKNLIEQNGYLIFENEKLKTINIQLIDQIKILRDIIDKLLYSNKKGDKNE